MGGGACDGVGACDTFSDGKGHDGQSRAQRNSAVFVGTSFGIIVNMHLHRKTHQFEALSDEVDNQIKGILHRMSEWLLQEDRKAYGSGCFATLDDALSRARLCAIENYDNSVLSDDTYEIDYIEMREDRVLF